MSGHRTDDVIKYDMDFTREKAEQLVHDACLRCENPRFYFVIGDKTYAVNPQDFFKDFDEVVKSHVRKEYLYNPANE